MAPMQNIAAIDAIDFDAYYAENTHVRKLHATDDEIRFPDGVIVDEDMGTLTLEEYRAMV